MQIRNVQTLQDCHFVGGNERGRLKIHLCVSPTPGQGYYNAISCSPRLSILCRTLGLDKSIAHLLAIQTNTPSRFVNKRL